MSATTAIRSLVSRFREIVSGHRAADTSEPLTICIYNEPDSGIDDATLRRIVLALAIQAQRDVAPAWDIPAPTIMMLPRQQAKPAGAHVATLDVVRNIPNMPGVGGYHLPLGESGDPFDGYISTAGLSVDEFSDVAGHEILETLIDPDCSQTRTAPNGDIWALEVGDPVQSADNSTRVPIDIGDGSAPVMGPNWTKRAFFDASTAATGSRAEKTWDAAGVLDKPFSIAIPGYAIITKAGQSQATDVFGPMGDRVELPLEKHHPEARNQVRKHKMWLSTPSVPLGPVKDVNFVMLDGSILLTTKAPAVGERLSVHCEDGRVWVERTTRPSAPVDKATDEEPLG